MQPDGTPDATSFYDTSALKSTLERLVDFDRINAGEMRFSVGAVNVGTGNFVYFDNSTHKIRPEHVMASGALPPGFPSIEIEGEHYWDGGLVSNTPLQWVLESAERQDTLAFQVDLWNARGSVPGTLGEVAMRQQTFSGPISSRIPPGIFCWSSMRRSLRASALPCPRSQRSSTCPQPPCFAGSTNSRATGG